MSLVDFAKQELEQLEVTCKDNEDLNMQKVINNDILQVIETFSNQGHSGFSANYALSIINRLLKFKPLSALTGEDSEWTKLDYTDDICYQNKRCFSVFKDITGKAYNTEGKVFSDDNGHTWYTSKDSRVYIEFPYNVPDEPERIIVDNKVDRDKYQSILWRIIQQFNSDCTIELEQFNEELELKNLLSEDKYQQLEDELKAELNVDKLEYSISNEDKIYHIVTNMLYSAENYKHEK